MSPNGAMRPWGEGTCGGQAMVADVFRQIDAGGGGTIGRDAFRRGFALMQQVGA